MLINELVGKKVAMCVSGGLDSKTVTKRLIEEGVEVVCFTADLDQPDEKDINDIPRKMEPCGAETIIVDLKDEMANACFSVIKSLARYDGGYWNTTGIARAVTVAGIVKEMKLHGCNVLAHGATGRGNDQMRFERYTTVIDPTIKVYAPWRDPSLIKQFPGRKEMASYLQIFNIPAVVGMKKRYSTDANLAGLTHEAEDLESLDTSCLIVEPIMGKWPHECEDKIEKIKITFRKGICISIDGKEMPPLDIMREANLRAGRNGIWMINALENRIIGTKSRGVYEAPGMELLGFAIQQIYQAVLDRRSLKLFNYLSSLIADQIYDGRFYDPVTTAALSAIDSFAEYATGSVELGLYKGNIYFNNLSDCPSSIYNEEDSSMEDSDGLSPSSSQGYAEILNVEAVALSKAGQIRRAF